MTACAEIVRHAFTPARVRELEDRVRDDVRRAVRDCLQAGGADAADRFAWTIPVGVVARLLGLDASARGRVTPLLKRIIHRQPGSERVGAETSSAARELGELLEAHADRRRAEPREDLMTDIVRAEAAGTLGRDERHGLLILLFVAGTETVADFIGNALVVLHEDPDQRALVASGPGLVPQAVEEILRFESPVQHQVRTSTRPVAVHRALIPEGARVVLLWGSANRDEARWERPDTFDVLRPPQRNLAFGEGIHHCLGAPLARLEGRIVLEEVLTAMPGYRITGPVEPVATHNTRGIARLPIAV